MKTSGISNQQSFWDRPRVDLKRMHVSSTLRNQVTQSSSGLPVYLTLKEVAELLKVKPRTIYAWVSDRRIPYERKGGLLRFRLDAVLDWNEPVR